MDSSVSLDHATHLIERALREESFIPKPWKANGLNLLGVIEYYASVSGAIAGQPQEKQRQVIARLTPSFLDAAWALAMRGILRGPQFHDGRVTGQDLPLIFSLTPQGREWINRKAADVSVPDPSAFGALFASHTERFGGAFHERSQEAARCYMSRAFLACCVMCAAADEAILLQASRLALGEGAALKAYLTSSGRASLAKKLGSRVSPAIFSLWERNSSLLNDWRNDASHGRGAKTLEDEQAFLALCLLLRQCELAAGRWAEFTKREAGSSTCVAGESDDIS